MGLKRLGLKRLGLKRLGAYVAFGRAERIAVKIRMRAPGAWDAVITGTIFVLTLSGLAACSATDPEPSPRFDGRYVGARVSDSAKDCGITEIQGQTSASVAHGRLTMPLFGPRTVLAGTVGDNGRVRASGIWRNPTGGFPGVTVLNGDIEGDLLSATASDFRCHTDVRLRRVASPAAGSRHR